MHGILLSVWLTVSELWLPWQMPKIVKACYLTTECYKSRRGLEMELA